MEEPNIKVELSKKVYEVDPKEVIIDIRQRELSNVKVDLEKLVESIRLYGQLQPGVCYKRAKFTGSKESSFVLLAGHRRLEACKRLKIPYRYQLTKINPGTPTGLAFKCIEYEENCNRVPLTWQEADKAIADIYKMYTKLFPQHKQKDTALFLGMSPSSVSRALERTIWADSIPEVAKAESKREATKLIGTLSNMAVINEKAKELDSEIEKTDYTKNCIHMDFEKFFTFTKDKFDIVIFDPPWAVEFDKVGKPQKADTNLKYDDNENLIDSYLQWLKMCYHLMSENSHLYLFFAIRHYNKVYKAIEEAGFITNGVPIVMRKVGMGTTRNPDLYPGRCWNPIAFCRKGKKPLIVKGRQDYIESNSVYRGLKNIHPSAVHPMVQYDLLERSAAPGDKILDPMAGSGSTGVAAELFKQEHYKVSWTLVEKDELWRAGQFEMLNNLEKFREKVIK